MIDRDTKLTLQNDMLKVWNENEFSKDQDSQHSQKALVVGSVNEAIDLIQKESIQSVCVTGSLHLIGSLFTSLNIDLDE